MKPNTNSTEFIDRAAMIWHEWKRDDFRSYEPRSSRAADAKRLWAIVYSADWKGSAGQKMERLLTLLPRAIETAARSPLFNARTTLWSVLRSPEGLERLAGGIVPAESGRGWESGIYDEQVIRLRLDEDTVAYVRAEAENQGLSCSALVMRIIELWLASSAAD